MTKFNANEVAKFIASQKYVCFEYQVRGLISKHFGCTTITAGKWVNRCLEMGLIKRSGKVAVCLV